MGKLLLLRTGSGLSVLLVDHTEDTGSGPAVDDGRVIFAENVVTKLLIECGCCR